MHCTPRKQHSKINLYSFLYLCTYIYLKGIVQPEKRGVESGTNRNVLTFAHNCRWFFFILHQLFKLHKNCFSVKSKKRGRIFLWVSGVFNDLQRTRPSCGRMIGSSPPPPLPSPVSKLDRRHPQPPMHLQRQGAFRYTSTDRGHIKRKMNVKKLGGDTQPIVTDYRWQGAYGTWYMVYGTLAVPRGSAYVRTFGHAVFATQNRRPHFFP